MHHMANEFTNDDKILEHHATSLGHDEYIRHT